MLALLVIATCAAAESDLNVVLILADDCTKADLGCYGGQAATPHLTALAAEGMQFDRCYQAAPMCSPTRHCLYTGVYPVKSGAYPNHTFVSNEEIGSIALDLRAHGYRTALSGKRHIGPAEVFPFEYSAKDNNPDMEAIDTLLVDCDVHDTPFLLIACSNEPHSPWTKGDANAYDAETLTLPPTWVDTPTTRADYRAYLAEITYFDSQVGEILALLEKHNHADQTLVIALSEQGSSFPFAKWTCYHAGLGSGMIVRWPGRVAAGDRTQAMVEYVDIVPTVLDAAGLKTDRTLDGRSFLPVLLGSTDEHKQSVFGIQTTRGIINGSEHYGIRSVQTGSVRLIHNLTPEIRFRNAIMPNRNPATQPKRKWMWEEWVDAATTDPRAAATVRRYQVRPEWELYDLADDPHELRNRIDDPEYAERIGTMKQTLADWMRDQGDLGQPTELEAPSHMRGGSKSGKRAGRTKKASRLESEGSSKQNAKRQNAD